MNPFGPDHEDLRTRAARILQAMGDTPIPAMDAIFDAHYAEELRMIVEELLDDGDLRPSSRICVWLVWSCDDVVGCYPSEHDAREARADLQHQLLCAHGADIDLLESIPITSAHGTCPGVGTTRCHR